MRIYADAATTRSFRRDDLLSFARSAQEEISFQRFDGYAVSAADVFSLLTTAMTTFGDRHAWPAELKLRPLYGPSHTFTRATGGTSSSSYRWSAFLEAVRDVDAFCRSAGRIPDQVWLGSESLSPADYLATLASAAQGIIVTGKAPSDVARKSGRFTADRYVADDSPALWNWVIFPEGFHAPRIMELARLQAWTLKPALLSASSSRAAR